MSLVRMRKNMQSWFKYAMFAIAVVVALGVFGFGVGTGIYRGQHNQDIGVLAVVDGEKIDRNEFEKAYEARLAEIQREPGTRMTPYREASLRTQMLDELVQRIIQEKAAKKEGVKASRREIKAKINEVVAQQVEQVRAQLLANQKGAKTDRELDQALRERGESLAKLKKKIRESIDMDALRAYVLMEKLREKWKSELDASDKALRASYDEVKLRLITVSTKKRTEIQAEQRAKDIVKKLRSGMDFATAAREYSDDPYAKEGGNTGFFMRRSYMQPEMANAVFRLKIGDISDPIKGPEGFVIAQVVERRSALPEDFNDPKKREEYVKSYLEQQVSRIESERLDEIRKSTKLDVKEPELKGSMMVREASPFMGLPPEERKIKMEGAIKEFQKALDNAGERSDIKARVYSQIAYTYEQLRRPGAFPTTKEERLKYREAEKNALLKALEYTESDDLRMMLADIAIEEGNYNSALEHLEIVAEAAYDDPQAHSMLLDKYKRMKKSGIPRIAELIKQEQNWMDEYEKKMREERANMRGQPPGNIPVSPGP